MSVICSHCHEEIEAKRDLIVTSSFFQYNAYHTNCYKYKKNLRKYSVDKQINGKQSLWAPILLLLFLIFNLQFESFRSEPVLIGIWIAFILGTFIERLIAYIKFEKKIKTENLQH